MKNNEEKSLIVFTFYVSIVCLFSNTPYLFAVLYNFALSRREREEKLEGDVRAKH